jgi:hypothetical protein
MNIACLAVISTGVAAIDFPGSPPCFTQADTAWDGQRGSARVVAHPAHGTAKTGTKAHQCRSELAVQRLSDLCGAVLQGQR